MCAMSGKWYVFACCPDAADWHCLLAKEVLQILWVLLRRSLEALPGVRGHEK